MMPNVYPELGGTYRYIIRRMYVPLMSGRLGIWCDMRLGVVCRCGRKVERLIVGGQCSSVGLFHAMGGFGGKIASWYCLSASARRSRARAEAREAAGCARGARSGRGKRGV